MRESGYAAVTSRRLAAKAGLKPPLVHYYFRTMDDLFMALFEKVAERLSKRQAVVMKSDKPLRALWEMASDPSSLVMTHEFIAMAHHHKGIRAEIAEFGSRMREWQAKVIAQVLKKKNVDSADWPPVVLAVVINGMARSLSLEDMLGNSVGHNETLVTIGRFIERLEG